MKTVKVLAAAIIAGSAITGAQQAMAYTAGDMYFRADFTRTNATGNAISTKGDRDARDLGQDRSSSASLGWMMADKFGFEFNTTTESLVLGNGSKDLDRGSKYHPYTLTANWFPLGGTGAQVQPYMGVGASFVKFTRRAENGLDDNSKWAPTAQAGVDYFLTKWLAVNGYAQFTHLRVDANDGAEKLKIDPLTIGAGLTFRF